MSPTPRVDGAPSRPAPFLKWAGGKRQILSKIMPRLLPRGAPPPRRYFEPFVGAGAVFFELRALESSGSPPFGVAESNPRVPIPCVLADVNPDLMRVYLAAQNEPRKLIEALRSERFVNQKDVYYAIRALDPDRMTPIDAAARFVYLNKCCFNGLYRVNKSGGFNVPFGDYKNPRFCDEPGILAASDALQGARVRLTDFEVACEDAGDGDVLYFDPPYLPISKTSDFTAYSRDGFKLADHQRLRDLCVSLAGRGARVVLSNSSADAIRALYAEEPFASLFVVEEVRASRVINSDPSKRGDVDELLAYSKWR